MANDARVSENMAKKFAREKDSPYVRWVGAEGLDIIDEVGRPEIRLIYDIYHSAVMDEDIGTVLSGRLDRVAHVHLADAPGRHEPGTGTMDWQARLDWLDRNGYRGMVGLEYKPTRPTPESLAALLRR